MGPHPSQAAGSDPGATMQEASAVVTSWLPDGLQVASGKQKRRPSSLARGPEKDVLAPNFSHTMGTLLGMPTND